MPQAEKPAMTSGPGALSQRTDGGPASKQAIRYVSGMPSYGDGQDLVNLQAQAPMGATPNPGKPLSPSTIAGAAAQSAPAQQSQVTPLTAPTQRPDEPVTTGAASGPGFGPSILGINPGSAAAAGGQSAKQTVQALAQHPDASPALKQLAATLGI